MPMRGGLSAGTRNAGTRSGSSLTTYRDLTLAAAAAAVAAAPGTSASPSLPGLSGEEGALPASLNPAQRTGVPFT